MAEQNLIAPPLFPGRGAQDNTAVLSPCYSAQVWALSPMSLHASFTVIGDWFWGTSHSVPCPWDLYSVWETKPETVCPFKCHLVL